jgi:hypothetical protein
VITGSLRARFWPTYDFMMRICEDNTRHIGSVNVATGSFGEGALSMRQRVKGPSPQALDSVTGSNYGQYWLMRCDPGRRHGPADVARIEYIGLFRSVPRLAGC